MRPDIRDIVDYFCGTTTALPREICKMILEISGNLKVGKKSLSYVTHNLPCFRGRIWSKHPPFDRRLCFYRGDRSMMIYSREK